MPNKGKVNKDDLLVNGFDLTPLAKHPRIIELRIVLMFDVFAREYNQDKAMNFFRSLCEITNIEWNRISAILNTYYSVKRMEATNELKYRQQVILMGLLWNDTRLYAATKYLGISKTTLYTRDNKLSLEDFISNEFLQDLSNAVGLCGQEAYKIEGIRFLEAYHRFSETVGYVSVPG